MRLLPCILLLGIVVAGCASDAPSDDEDTGAAFVTLLGDDTVAVELFEREGLTMTTDVILRSPRTTLRHYEIEVDGFGNLVRYEATVRVPEAPADTPPLLHEVVEPAGDSLRMTITERGASQTSVIPGSDQALPFIDMVHWPFEMALRRAHASPEDTVTQELFTRQGTMPFEIARRERERMTIQHPFRGTMAVQVDTAGRLQFLDARNTTRKLVVHRVPDVDFDALAERFAQMDAAGGSFGELSGRGESVARIDGATIHIDYGRPAKRGRQVFGETVPFGEVWRTGANLATHLTTDKTLAFGELEVPPGRYTLFSIPRENDATLIVNRQTEQGGTSYDPQRDLGRVEMRKETLAETVEVLTIDLTDTPQGGNLRLRWDRTAFVAPFIVR